MPITISESPAVESFKSAWANMVEAIEPDVDMLPEPWKSIFKGPIQLLISSNLSLGIIPEKRMWAMIEKVNWIYSMLKYPDFFNYDLEFIASQIGELFSMNHLGMAHNGKFLLEGPMSRQFVHQTSRLLEEGNRPVKHSRRGGYYE